MKAKTSCHVNKYRAELAQMKFVANSRLPEVATTPVTKSGLFYCFSVRREMNEQIKTVTMQTLNMPQHNKCMQTHSHTDTCTQFGVFSEAFTNAVFRSGGSRELLCRCGGITPIGVLVVFRCCWRCCCLRGGRVVDATPLFGGVVAAVVVLVVVNKRGPPTCFGGGLFAGWTGPKALSNRSPKCLYLAVVLSSASKVSVSSYPASQCTPVPHIYMQARQGTVVGVVSQPGPLCTQCHMDLVSSHPGP